MASSSPAADILNSSNEYLIRVLKIESQRSQEETRLRDAAPVFYYHRQDVDVQKTDSDQHQLSFRLPRDVNVTLVDGEIGDIAKLEAGLTTAKLDFFVDGLRHMRETSISAVKEDRFVVFVSLKADVQNFFGVNVSFVNESSSFCRRLEALHMLLTGECKHRDRRYVMSRSLSKAICDYSPEIFMSTGSMGSQLRARLLSDGLNDVQVNVVDSVLNKRLTLLQGPPGTGKTTTLSEAIVAYLQKFPTHKILLTAASHQATDTLALSVLKKLQKYGFSVDHIVRLGASNEKVHPEMRAFSLRKKALEELVKEGDVYQEVARKCRGPVRLVHIFWFLLERARICVSTCDNVGNGMYNGTMFDLVVIDEGSQVLTAEGLCAARHSKQSLVLGGDIEQLGPVASSPEMADTLYEELWKKYGHEYGLFLEVQYRMMASLMDFTSKTFYDNRLRAGLRRELRLPFVLRWPGLDVEKPFAFVHIAGVEHRDDFGGNSFYNDQEVSHLIDFIVSFLKPRIQNASTTTVGIITGYDAQKQRLQKAFESEVAEGRIRIGTVDSFQGTEFDLLIVTLVRSNPLGNVGFMADRRRINVALSRQKAGLLVVGNATTMSSDSTWRQFLEHALEKEVLLSHSFGKLSRQQYGVIAQKKLVLVTNAPYQISTQELQAQLMTLRQNVPRILSLDALYAKDVSSSDRNLGLKSGKFLASVVAASDVDSLVGNGSAPITFAKKTRSAKVYGLEVGKAEEMIRVHNFILSHCTSVFLRGLLKSNDFFDRRSDVEQARFVSMITSGARVLEIIWKTDTRGERNGEAIVRLEGNEDARLVLSRDPFKTSFYSFVEIAPYVDFRVP